MLGASQCAAWVWIEEGSLEDVHRVVANIMRVRQTLLSMERSKSKEDIRESDTDLKISISKKFMCFLSRRCGSAWEIPAGLRENFREVSVTGIDYVNLIQTRLELFGIENERQTIERVVGSMVKTGRGVTELVLVMNSIFTELDQLSFDSAEDNLQIFSIQNKIKFKKLFLGKFSQLTQIPNFESKRNVSKFSIQRETQLSFQKIEHNLHSLASVQLVQRSSKHLHQKIFQSLTGRAINDSLSQSICAVQQILEQKGKVMLLGHTSSGKSFALDTLKASYELLHGIVLENVENSSLEDNLYNPLIKTIGSARGKILVSQRRVHVDGTAPPLEFRSNRSVSAVERAWMDLQSQGTSEGLLRWLVIDGQLSEHDQAFLEEVEDLEVKANLMHLPQSEQSFPSKFRTSNPGVQVVLEMGDVSRYSPRLCIEYPIVFFKSSKGQVLDLFARSLQLPRDELIMEEVGDFLEKICVPYFKLLKKFSEASAPQEKAKKYKIKNTTRRLYHRTKTKLQSMMSFKDMSQVPQTGLFDGDLFQEPQIWAVMVNTANIFESFLESLRDKMRVTLSTREKDSLEVQPLQKQATLRSLVHRNVVKVLCIFSLHAGQLHKHEKKNRRGKLLKKICKKHFINADKRRREEHRAKRARGNFGWFSEAEKAVELPAQELAAVFPTLVETSAGTISVEFESFDDNVDLLRLNSESETRMGRASSSRNGSLRILGSHGIFSKNSFHNDSFLGSAKFSLQETNVSRDCIFVENRRTWMLKNFFGVLSQSRRLKVVCGESRSGKLRSLQSFLEDRPSLIRLRVDGFVARRGLWKSLARLCKARVTGPVPVILENVFLASHEISERLESEARHLDWASFKRSFGIACKHKNLKARFCLWGTTRASQKPLEPRRLLGKTCVVRAQNFDEKELKQVFQVYFFNLLGNSPLVFNLKDKIVKGVAVILDSLQELGEGCISLSQGVNLIERVVKNLKSVFASIQAEAGQQSFFRQENRHQGFALGAQPRDLRAPRLPLAGAGRVFLGGKNRSAQQTSQIVFPQENEHQPRPGLPEPLHEGKIDLRGNPRSRTHQTGALRRQSAHPELASAAEAAAFAQSGFRAPVAEPGRRLLSESPRRVRAPPAHGSSAALRRRPGLRIGVPAGCQTARWRRLPRNLRHGTSFFGAEARLGAARPPVLR